jgi:uncharacterized membrane protein YgcG
MGKIFRFSRVFETREDAYSWKEKENTPEKETILVADSDSSPDDDSSSDDSDPRESRNRRSRNNRKKKKKKKPSKLSKKAKGTGRSRHRDPSPPPSSSSSDPSSSESDSTDSSSARARRRRHGKKKKASRKTKRKSKEELETKTFFGNDPSVGNRKRVHDLPINGKEIDKAAGPPEMRSKDSSELWNAAVDVTALPGMFISIGSGGGDIDDEAQRTTEMAATLIATVIGKRAQIHDSLWKTQKRHSLGQVRNMESLFKFVKSVAKSEESAFEQQENALQVFMLPRHYDERVINEYIQNGFLPRLTGATFRFYSNLLSTVRQLAFDHAAFWEKGPAKAMLDFHSGRLLTIRQNSLTRKALILQTYTYLRDANSKSFYHESMTESLWDRLSDLSSVTGGNGGQTGLGTGDNDGNGASGGGGGDTKLPRCSHCRNPKMHELMRVRPSKQVCPLKDLSPKKAREVAKNAIEAYNRNPSDEVFQNVLENVKNPGGE